MFLLSLLSSLITGPLKSISNDIKELQIAKVQAQNDSEKLAYDERINLLEARKSVIQSSMPDPLWRFCRACITIPFVIYINKLVIWDKVLGWGATDSLSAELSYIMMMILGSYFLDSGIRAFKK
jgi:hypothetical protein